MELLPIALIIIGIIVLIIVFFYIIPLGLWLWALFSGVHVSLVQLIFMRLRKVPPGVIVNSMVTATKAGLTISLNDLEAHYLAGGNVLSVTNALRRPLQLTLPGAMCLTLCSYQLRPV